MISETICEICESIVRPPSIKLGVTDIRSILQNGGYAVISTGEASEGNKARIALRRCFDKLFNVKFSDAKNAFIHVSGFDLTPLAIEYIERSSRERINSTTTDIVFGARLSKNPDDKTRILILLTGLEIPQKFLAIKK